VPVPSTRCCVEKDIVATGVGAFVFCNLTRHQGTKYPSLLRADNFVSPDVGTCDIMYLNTPPIVGV